MKNIPELFASMVLDSKTLKSRLPGDVYRTFMKTAEENSPLSLETANHVANAMKEWAIEKGATHYTHWFQPMTGITAGKHESFIMPSENNEIVMEFSGKELIKGEPDASSFPSGGLRATFEARGYTSWDPASPVFIMDSTLYIPTVFCSYSGEVLDKKTPLLKSLEALNIQALRVLSLIGHDDVRKVSATLGAEQEYFLIDRDVFRKRKDLMLCGRTLFGSKPPKGQEMEDHYFGSIKPRVSKFMKELDTELWKLGIYAKTRHNEVAPSQHELAPVFTESNLAVDHNQLTMEMMKKIAETHSLACLLHEKPFAGINGSGKHNNWSLCTDTGRNLLEPGPCPENNMVFLVMLSCFIKAVDRHADLLRASVSGAGNDHRLGGHEAPPAIVSIFLGDELSSILDSIEGGSEFIRGELSMFRSGAGSLADFKKDTSDRNRTSPIAFTGNKFEFRMPGSSFSLSGPNIILNTAMADSLREFADRLESLLSGCGMDNLHRVVTEILREDIRNHKRIIFNGNGYSRQWEQEASDRGLENIRSSADAFRKLCTEKSLSLFSVHGVFTREEAESRCRVMLDNYCKVISIEALTMLDIVRKDILPSAIAYTQTLINYHSGLAEFTATSERIPSHSLISRLSSLANSLIRRSDELESMLTRSRNILDLQEAARYMGEDVTSAMNLLRTSADEIEMLLPSELMPYPSYSELLFSI